MQVHLNGVACGKPGAALILVVSDEFFLFRVDGDHWIASFEIRLGFLIDVLELRVSIWVVRSFLGFLVPLEAIVMFFQDLPRFRMTDLVVLLLEFSGQPAQALMRPSQRRYRVSLGGIFNPCQQVRFERCVGFRQLFTATARLPVAVFRQADARLQFPHSFADRGQ